MNPRSTWFRIFQRGSRSNLSSKRILLLSRRVVGASSWRCRVWSEHVYYYLPIALQNLAVSIKGWQFHRERYRSPSFEGTARTLAQNEKLSLGALNELQFCLLRSFAAHSF